VSLRYFISDLHLGPDQPGLSALFADFLSRLEPETRELWILGDLFESWIGDDDDDPWLLPITAQLRTVAERGVQMHFLHGNRDFLLGQRWAGDVGIELHAAPQRIEIAGQASLLMHGDELCLGDVAYQQLRTTVRNPAWQQQVLGLPLPVRRMKAEELRKASREQTRMKASDIMDVDADEVARVMSANAVARLLHGHTHRPAIHRLSGAQGSGPQVFSAGQRIVLGDWGAQPSFLREASDGLSLCFAGETLQVPRLAPADCVPV